LILEKKDPESKELACVFENNQEKSISFTPLCEPSMKCFIGINMFKPFKDKIPTVESFNEFNTYISWTHLSNNDFMLSDIHYVLKRIDKQYTKIEAHIISTNEVIKFMWDTNTVLLLGRYSENHPGTAIFDNLSCGRPMSKFLLEYDSMLLSSTHALLRMNGSKNYEILGIKPGTYVYFYLKSATLTLKLSYPVQFTNGYNICAYDKVCYDKVLEKEKSTISNQGNSISVSSAITTRSLPQSNIS